MENASKIHHKLCDAKCDILAALKCTHFFLVSGDFCNFGGYGFISENKITWIATKLFNEIKRTKK